MRRALLLVVCAVVLLAIGWWKVDRGGGRALSASDAALASSDYPLAISNAKLAAQSRGTRWSQDGFKHLDDIANAAEIRGDVDTMKSAFVAMRAAADSTDDSDWREKANTGLARAAMRADTSPDARQKEGCSAVGTPPCTNAMKLELATPTHPPRSSHALVAIGFGVFLGLALFVTRTRRAKKRAKS